MLNCQYLDHILVLRVLLEVEEAYHQCCYLDSCGINEGTLITPPVAAPAGLNVPGGTLIMLTGGGVPVLTGAFGPNGAITPVVLTEP
jgi:hypothetical protein